MIVCWQDLYAARWDLIVRRLGIIDVPFVRTMSRLQRDKSSDRECRMPEICKD